MKTVTSTFLNRNLGRVVQAALAGRPTLVTRYGVPMAVFTPADRCDRHAERISATTLFNTLGSCLDRVSQGERFLITRHGRDVAMLISSDTLF